MSLLINSASASGLALAAAPAGSLTAEQQDLLAVYKISISDEAPEQRGERLIEIGHRLAEGEQWVAAASTYKAAALAWADIPVVDPVWGLPPQYLEPLERAADALSRSPRSREAADLYAILSKQYERATCELPQDKYLAGVHATLTDRARNAYARSQSVEGATPLPVFTIRLSALACITAGEDHRIQGLQIGYVEVPFAALLQSRVLGINKRPYQWPLPTLGAKLLYDRNHHVGELTHRARDPRNRRRTDTLDIYKVRLPQRDDLGTQLSDQVNFMLDIHQLAAKPGLTAIISALQLRKLLRMDPASREILDHIAERAKPWLKVGDSFRVTMQSEDDNIQQPSMSLTFNRTNGFVEYKVELRAPRF